MACRISHEGVPEKKIFRTSSGGGGGGGGGPFKT